MLLGARFIKAEFSKELDEQLGLVNKLVIKQMARCTVKCTCCGKTIVYRGVVIPKFTNCSGKVPSKNHQDPAETQTQAQTQTRKKRRSGKKTGNDDSDSSATSEKQCSENKLWRSDVYYHAVLEKAKNIRGSSCKVNRKMCDHLSTGHSTIRRLNSAVYGQPSFCLTVISASMTYQISGNKNLVDMFLRDKNMAKMKKLHEDVWSRNKIIQKDPSIDEKTPAAEREVEIDKQELFANYVTLQIHMMDDDEFIKLALGKEAVDGQPGIKANLIRARQMTSALAKANNLNQGKGISAQFT